MAITTSNSTRVKPFFTKTLLECMTFRMRGHEEASGIAYVPQQALDEWAQRDPIRQFERILKSQEILNEREIESIKQELESRVRGLTDASRSAPPPSSTIERELTDVYAPSINENIAPKAPFKEMRYVDAIRNALLCQMESESKTILLGQDIAEYGGVFKVTEGFVERFGPGRVRNTPIDESAAIGAALGLPLVQRPPGRRPADQGRRPLRRADALGHARRRRAPGPPRGAGLRGLARRNAPGRSGRRRLETGPAVPLGPRAAAGGGPGRRRRPLLRAPAPRRRRAQLSRRRPSCG